MEIRRFIESYPSTGYTLIELEGHKIQPFVVCYRFNHKDNTWAQGHYFSNEFAARIFAMQKEIDNLKELRMADIDQISDCILKMENMMDCLYETLDRLPIRN